MQRVEANEERVAWQVQGKIIINGCTVCVCMYIANKSVRIVADLSEAFFVRFCLYLFVEVVVACNCCHTTFYMTNNEASYTNTPYFANSTEAFFRAS